MLTTILIAFCFFLLFAILICWCLFTISDPAEPWEFHEPQSDAKFENLNLGSPPPPELVEVDTAGVPTVPDEIMVYRYRWSAALGRMETLPPIPLSQYTLLQDGPEVEQVIGRQEPFWDSPAVKARMSGKTAALAAAVTWDHAALKLPSGPAATAHGAPLDCALGASPLPPCLGKFEV